MTDEKYIYLQDIREKKSAGRGVFGKRTGGKTRYVGLPHDHMTAAELKRRNGKVSSVKLNMPITYEELKELTPSLRFLYLDNLIHRYKARRIDLVAMLGISNPGFGNMMAKLPGKLEFKGSHHKPAPEWLAFINGEAAEIVPEDVRDLRDPVPAAAEPAVVEPIPDEPTVEVSPVVLDSPVLVAKPEINPYRVTLSLVGTPAQLADVIAVLTDKDTAYDFEVTISMKGGD